MAAARRGPSAPVSRRMRASMTLARSRAPVSDRPLIARSATAATSRPAASAARIVRHSQVACGESSFSDSYPGGSAAPMTCR